MAAATANSGAQQALKITWLIKDKGAMPADYKTSTINTYLTDAVDNSTRVKVRTGAGFNPSKNFSELTTEGENVVQSLSLSGEWIIVAQTPEEYKALKTAFDDKQCVLVGVIGNPDLNIDASGVVTVNDANGDQILISHTMRLNFALNPVDDTEMEIGLDFQKTVAGNVDTVAAWEAILPDA